MSAAEHENVAEFVGQVDTLERDPFALEDATVKVSITARLDSGKPSKSVVLYVKEDIANRLRYGETLWINLSRRTTP